MHNLKEQLGPLRPLAGEYTRGDAERIIAEGSIAELCSLRTSIAEVKRSIEMQLARHKATPQGDEQWAKRANGARSALDTWIGRVNDRLRELSSGRSSMAAVAIAGAATNSAAATNAINALLERGCKVFAFGAIGKDLVVVATEPTEPTS